jgi:hypothetical protein
MNFRPWKVGGWLALLSGTSLLLARGADPAGPAVPPAPSLSATLTNLNSTGPKRDGLKQLEEELTKSLQPFSPKGLDNILTPRYVPPPVVLPDRRQPSDSEKRGTWPFDNAEDRSGLSRDPFKSMQGSTKKNSLEEIYNTLDEERRKSRASSGKSGSAKSSSLKPFDDLNGDNDENGKLPIGIRESAKSLRDKLLGTDNIFTRSTSGGGLSSLFAPQENGLAREQIQAHKEYMERFRETIGLPTTGLTPQNSLNAKFWLGLGGSPGLGAAPAKPAYSPPDLLSAPAARENTFASTPAAAESVLHPLTLPDVNERVLNNWNPLYATPKAEPPPPAPFAPPMMEVPRRRF